MIQEAAVKLKTFGDLETVAEKAMAIGLPRGPARQSVIPEGRRRLTGVTAPVIDQMTISVT
jgi:hypothetical protein